MEVAVGVKTAVEVVKVSMDHTVEQRHTGDAKQDEHSWSS